MCSTCTYFLHVHTSCKLETKAKLVNSGVIVSPEIKTQELNMDSHATLEHEKSNEENSEVTDALLLETSQQYEMMSQVVTNQDDEVVIAVDNETSEDSDNDDTLLLEASQEYEAMIMNAEDTSENVQQNIEGTGEVDSVDDELLLIAKASEQFESRFGKPATESVIDEVRKSGIPVKTKQSTDWAVNIMERVGSL